MQIRIDNVQLQVISNSSRICWGNSLHMKTGSILKINQGCGTISGDENRLMIDSNTVIDTDISDINAACGSSIPVENDTTIR